MSQNPVYAKTDSIFDDPRVIEPTEGLIEPDDMQIDQWQVGKIQVVEYPMALPSYCACCGAVPNPDSVNRRYFIDWGMSIDSYGQVYFCTDCFVAAAKILGYSSPKETAELAERTDAAVAESIAVRSENESIKSGLAAVSDLNFIFRDSGRDRPIDKVPDESVEFSNETEPGIDTPVDEQGTDDIPSTTGNDKSSNDRSDLSFDE